VLKSKFRGLHTEVVSSVNPASVMDFLFKQHVLGVDDYNALNRIKDDPQQQCKDLLALLHRSENPKAFIQLYAAIKEDSTLGWLVERIDQFTDQSLDDLLQQQRYISEPTGSMCFNLWLTAIYSLFHSVTADKRTHVLIIQQANCALQLHIDRNELATI